MKRRKILIAAGGSGGHLLPAQQLFLLLRERADLLFAGHRLGESAFFQHEHFPYCSIEASPFSRSFKGLSRFIWISGRSVGKAASLLRSFQPDLVVGFGSYHTFPILAAAALLRKKIILFEANCQLGKVNRLFSPFAECLAAQFPLHGRNAELVPLLPWKERALFLDKTAALRHFGLNPDRKTCLVFGGSQGAAFLNRTVPGVLPSSVQAIHLTGKKEAVEEVSGLYAKAGVRAVVKAYEVEMEKAYAASDLAICRSGASTIAELIGCALPALLIPFPFSADGHQIANAEFLAKKVGGATMILEERAHRETLLGEMMRLIENRDLFCAALAAHRKECEGRKSFAARILMGE